MALDRILTKTLWTVFQNAVSRSKVVAKSLYIFFFATQSLTARAVDCDKVAAINAKIMLLDLTTWNKERSHIAVHWTYEIEKQSKDKQLKMIRTFADTDACLSNEAREFWFYRNKRLIGIASPTRGIKLVD